MRAFSLSRKYRSPATPHLLRRSGRRHVRVLATCSYSLRREWYVTNSMLPCLYRPVCSICSDNLFYLVGRGAKSFRPASPQTDAGASRRSVGPAQPRRSGGALQDRLQPRSQLDRRLQTESDADDRRRAIPVLLTTQGKFPAFFYYRLQRRRATDLHLQRG